MENLLQMLKRFKNFVCWKELLRLKQIKESLAKGKKLCIEKGKDDLEEVGEDDDDTAINEANFEGLGT
eukprot:13478538-Ditylum_brightwellii.AAC.1